MKQVLQTRDYNKTEHIFKIPDVCPSGCNKIKDIYILSLVFNMFNNVGNI